MSAPAAARKRVATSPPPPRREVFEELPDELRLELLKQRADTRQRAKLALSGSLPSLRAMDLEVVARRSAKPSVVLVRYYTHDGKLHSYHAIPVSLLADETVTFCLTITHGGGRIYFAPHANILMAIAGFGSYKVPPEQRINDLNVLAQVDLREPPDVANPGRPSKPAARAAPVRASELPMAAEAAVPAGHASLPVDDAAP